MSVEREEGWRTEPPKALPHLPSSSSSSCLSHLAAFPQLKEDAKFQEFLSIHQKRTQVATWANDTLDSEPPKTKTKPSSDYLNFDSDSNSDSGQESEEEPAQEDPGGGCASRECCASWECEGLCQALA